jgi:hypothetical protein
VVNFSLGRDSSPMSKLSRSFLSLFRSLSFRWKPLLDSNRSYQKISFFCHIFLEMNDKFPIYIENLPPSVTKPFLNELGDETGL